MKFNERREKILEAIIKEYILTAEPIGSRTLSKRYQLGVSSATIRNEMADLEEMGYLKQPHTSAGRIPSDKGYRFYVDSITNVQDIPKSLERFIQEKYLAKQNEIKEVIEMTSQVLSSLTKYTAVVTSPQTKKVKFQGIQLIPLGEKRVLLIIIVDDGVACQRILTLSNIPKRDDLEDISRFLNNRLDGLFLSDITAKLLQDIEKNLCNNLEFYRQVQEDISLLVLKSMQQENAKIYLDGVMNILEQPEFFDVEKFKIVFRLFEQGETLRHLIEMSSINGLSVVIGNENPLDEMKDCSLVIANYSCRDQSLGKIAILGPTRMEYTKVISMVNFMSKLLTKILHEGA